MTLSLDHLVVAARTLEEGAAWLDARLGVATVPGGRHALMGTHNRLLSLGSGAYLEIIAIDPEAPPPGRARWFGIDEPALQAAVRVSPRLHHVVLRSPNIEMHRWGLVNLGLNPGLPLAAQRETPEGPLSWRILVRDDGAIECGAALPTLIEWQGRHPTAAMAPSPLQLVAVTMAGLPAPVRSLLRPRAVAMAERGAGGVDLLQVKLATPRGLVTLSTRSLS